MSTKHLFLFVAGLLAAGSLLAQSIHGGIQGTITSSGGKALAGVEVVVSSAALQGTRSATTDSGGKFRFSLLPPGVYQAVFSLADHETLEYPGIRVAMEAVVTLEVTMYIVFEAIDVVERAPVIDVTSTAIGDEFGPEIMKALPAGRDVSALTFLAGGAVDGGAYADDRLAGNPSIMGASALENRYVVDQLDTTDVATGLSGTAIAFDFVDEIQVKTGGYEAEYGGALGGVVNMVTKSGGNQLRGDVFAYFSNDSLWADAEVPATRGDVRTVDQAYDVGATLGGKILADRLWYFLAYNPSRLEQRIVNDVYCGDAVCNRNDFIRTFKRDSFTAKLTWQLNEHQSLVANVLGDPTTVENDFRWTNVVDSPLAETNNRYDTDRGGLNYGLSWNAVLTDDVFLEAKLGHHETTDEADPYVDAPAYHDLTADGLWTGGASGNPWFGGVDFYHEEDDRSRDQARLALNWYLGDRHQIKLGGGYNDVKYDIYHRNSGSSSAFCVPAPGGVWLYDATTGDFVLLPNDCSVNGDGILDGLMVPDRVGNQFMLADGYYYKLDFVSRSNGDTVETNLFVQDSWQITDTFTLQLGVRAESSRSEGNYTAISPDVSLDFGFSDMIAPRVGFVWDFLANGRSKLYGHYGKFYQSIPLTINVRAFGNETIDLPFYEYPDNGLLPSVDNPGNMFYVYRLSPGGAKIDPDLKPQYLEEYVFGGEAEVADNLTVGVKYVRREMGEVIEDVSVDGGFTFFITNPGGTYTVNPATGMPLDEPVDFPEAERDYQAVELTAHKRLADGWQLRASLLWSELEGNYEGLYSRDNRQIDPNITTKFDLPELLSNAYGLLPNDREWQFKAFGSYAFDFGLVTGFNFFYLTGSPISKLGAQMYYGPDERFVTPRGSEGRTEDWWSLDFHLGYPITIGTTRLEAMVDVFNVFDQQPAIEVDQRWTIYDETADDPNAQTNDDWGEPLVFAPPRNIRLGVKFSW